MPKAQGSLKITYTAFLFLRETLFICWCAFYMFICNYGRKFKILKYNYFVTCSLHLKYHEHTFILLLTQSTVYYKWKLLKLNSVKENVLHGSRTSHRTQERTAGTGGASTNSPRCMAPSSRSLYCALSSLCSQFPAFVHSSDHQLSSCTSVIRNA